MDLVKIYKTLFLIMVFLCCFTCYSRADYNLPLFAFAYLMWEHKPSQHVRFYFLFLFSWIIDLVWLIYWGTFWDSKVFEHNWAKGVHTFVLVLSIINFVLKFACLVLIFLSDLEVKEAFTPEGFASNFKSLFGANKGESSNIETHNMVYK